MLYLYLNALSLLPSHLTGFIAYWNLIKVTYLLTITYPAWHKITPRMFTRHYDVNDVTKRAKLTLWKHVTSGRLSLL